MPLLLQELRGSGTQWTTATAVSSFHAFSTLKLTPPEIVEFLKSSLVQSDHRRAFFDLLEAVMVAGSATTGRPWNSPRPRISGWNFTTRVKRPDPKAILENIRTLLDEEATK